MSPPQSCGRAIVRSSALMAAWWLAAPPLEAQYPVRTMGRMFSSKRSYRRLILHRIHKQKRQSDVDSAGQRGQ